MAVLGTGTTVVFGTSAFSANLLSLTGPNEERVSVDATHMASTTMEFIPGELVDGGDADLELEFDGAFAPPISGATETITIDYGGEGTGKKYTFSAFITAVSPTIPLEDRMTATVSLKVTGAVTKAVV